MKLSNLCQAVGISLPSWVRDVVVHGISQNSKTVEKQDLFIATSTNDALAHIKEAYQKGASAVITTPAINAAIDPDFALPVVPILKPIRRVISELSQVFYAPYPENVIAITGTNGKTSTASFVYQMLYHIDKPSAYIGTTGYENNLDIALHLPELTSPSAPDIHRALNRLRQEGCTHACIEASSHALDQYRLHGLPITCAAFTNLTLDHLDYHGSMDDYLIAKLRLFQDILPSEGISVVNLDAGPSNEFIKTSEKRHHKIITYGIERPDADFFATNIQLMPNHILFDVMGPSKAFHNMSASLVGEFQVYNILCAMSIVHMLGVEEWQLRELVSKLRAPKGRMEYVGTIHGDSGVYVDYAHTPDALQKTLQSLKKQTKGHLAVVFGCGGDRDTSKRKMMGEVAQKYADIIYVTDDNPRTENPDDIRAQILEGCSGIDIGDRKIAIATAIQNLKPKDNLVIAGKGHEAYQIVGRKRIPFSDQDHAKTCIKNVKKLSKDSVNALAS